jgi:hypothetical protein
VILAAMGLAGATLGHVGSYLLAHTDAHERATVLARSGHGYGGAVVHIAAFALLGALLGHAALALRDKRPLVSPVRAPWCELALAQSSIFVVAEILERLVSGAAGPWHEPAFWVALPLQVAVAAAATLLLRGTAVAAVAIARRMLGTNAVEQTVHVSAMRSMRLVTQGFLSQGRIRAPPRPIGL